MTAPEEPTFPSDEQNAQGNDAPQQPAPAAPGAPVPPPPPGQQPYAPQQPYGAPYGQAPQQPQPQQPYGYGQTPQQPYGQQPYGAAPQPPYPGYPAQPPYPVAPEQPKKKVWPWVLGGCLVAFVLFVGGLVGCVSCAVMMGERYDSSYYGYSDSYDDYDYRYNYPYDDSDSGDYSGQLTYESIKEAAGNLPNNVIDGKCTSGVYRVGASADIEPGRYFFEGSTGEEGYFSVFDGDGSGGYDIQSAVAYFGNYFADFEEGDLVVFMGAADDRMYLADEADFKPEAPYECGLFLVGTDIPAGTYTVTTQDEAAAVADSESAAFVMKDLAFDDDSITDTKYVVKGGSQTITVQDGEWLELYAATATPAE